MYRIRFEDGTIWDGGKSPRDSNWNEMPRKPIQKIEYSLGKKTLVMENFEAYNHIYEVGSFIFQGKGVLLNVKVMAKQYEKVHIFIYNFLENRVDKEICEFGHEHNGKATTGWKEGTVGETPKMYAI